MRPPDAFESLQRQKAADGNGTDGDATQAAAPEPPPASVPRVPPRSRTSRTATDMAPPECPLSNDDEDEDDKAEGGSDEGDEDDDEDSDEDIDEDDSSSPA